MLRDGETLKQHDRRIAREYRQALKRVGKLMAKSVQATLDKPTPFTELSRKLNTPEPCETCPMNWHYYHGDKCQPCEHLNCRTDGDKFYCPDCKVRFGNARVLTKAKVDSLVTNAVVSDAVDATCECRQMDRQGLCARCLTGRVFWPAFGQWNHVLKNGGSMTTDNHSEPTYENQLWHARKLLAEKGAEAVNNPHAMIGRTCGCGECFCCAAKQVLDEAGFIPRPS